MKRRSLRHALAFIFAFAILAAWAYPRRAFLRPDRLSALVWFKTLDFPDAKNLPYVRVATGGSSRTGNEAPVNTFVEGFLVKEDVDSFTVFLCSIPDLKGPFQISPFYSLLTTVRFVRRNTGPAYQQTGYEVLDFDEVSSDALDRVRRASMGQFWGRSGRSQVFAFAQACRQKGLLEKASALMNFTGNVLDDQTGDPVPWSLRETLQREIGAAVLRRAEKDWGDASISWAELLKVYEKFDRRFPACPKVDYAQESADLLRKMIAEESAHHPKPVEQMTSAEQAAENIYQLRYLNTSYPSIHSGYPLSVGTRKGEEGNTPVHRLVALGDKAVPQLIEALDDRRFTRTMTPQFNGGIPPTVMRVGDFAREILGYLAGRSFYARGTNNGAVRQQVEAWWREAQSKGEKQVLVETTAAGGQAGLTAARKLAEKYPDAAIDAIEAAILATKEQGYRGEFVEVAGNLPGNMPLVFLRSKLAPGNGLYCQVYAARALFARREPGAVPAMIEAWRSAQPRFPADESDVYSEIGPVIAFLAGSGNPEAIDALRSDMGKTPVDVRLAIVKAFAPWSTIGGGSWTGKSVDIMQLPPGLEMQPEENADVAIEHLLVAALDDNGRRAHMKGLFNHLHYEDPRICDFAAAILAIRSPKKYGFRWSSNAAECDAQIAVLRDQWRAKNSPSSQPP